MARRLTRDEQRQRTRDRLLEAAAAVFARQGFHATSVDEVAEAAGYSKGAVYSNFESKEELFLALLDRHVDQAIEHLERLLAQAEPAARARLVGDGRDGMAVFDRDWLLLETEFVLYAARNASARAQVARRQAHTMRRLASIVARHLDDLGAGGRFDPEDLATLLAAAGDGLTLASLTRTDLDASRLLTLLVQVVEAAATAGATEPRLNSRA